MYTIFNLSLNSPGVQIGHQEDNEACTGEDNDANQSDAQ